LKSDEGTEVAVKIYHPDIKAIDIQKEIDAMTQLKHDYIIPLKGILLMYFVQVCFPFSWCFIFGGNPNVLTLSNVV
jgi:hypothetical protein